MKDNRSLTANQILLPIGQPGKCFNLNHVAAIDFGKHGFIVANGPGEKHQALLKSR
ncbi:hypothetical protein HMPREF0880_02443 [Yokenella regensburgei ATCC 43003]|nr:hypothetical protein HMPREF0880_02443 [Yokenella regensburgei ATCC 43003]